MQDGIAYGDYKYKVEYDEEEDCKRILLWSDSDATDHVALIYSNAIDLDVHLPKLVALYEKRKEPVDMSKQIMIVYQHQVEDKWPVVAMSLHNKDEVTKHKAIKLAEETLKLNAKEGHVMRAIIADVLQAIVIDARQQPEPEQSAPEPEPDQHED